jgi:hypothetical protein
MMTIIYTELLGSHEREMPKNPEGIYDWKGSGREDDNELAASSFHVPGPSPVRTSSMRACRKAREIAGGRSQSSVTGVTQTGRKIGNEVSDGTIYAGISPDTGRAMYATPKDASGVYDFNQAASYAKTLDAHGHKDWRVPTQNELDVLYQNRDKGKLKGTFNETGAYPAGWYWSSSPYCGDYGWGRRDIYSADRDFGDLGWALRFSDGAEAFYLGGFPSSLRCVR